MNNITEALAVRFEDNRVIFWYDEKSSFTEDFQQFNLENVEKVHMQGNEFEVKYRINKLSPKGKFLLYFTGEKPKNEDNWLLDMELAHYVFRTEQEAMFLQEIGLDYHFKELVTQHLDFFKNKDRRAKLKDLLEKDDQHEQIRMKMLAVVFNTDEPRLTIFLQVQASAYYNGNEKFERDLINYNLHDFYWGEIKKKYKYRSETVSIYDFLLEVFNDNFVFGKKLNLAKDSRLLLSAWRDSILYREFFSKISDKIAIDISVENKLNQATIDDIIHDELFKLSDYKIIHELSQLIESEGISHERIENYVKLRENKFWYKELSDLYQSLIFASALISMIHKVGKTQYETIKQGTSDYANALYEVDYLYRKFILHYRKTSQDRILSNIAQKIEKVYSNDWLLVYNDNWQKLIDKQTTWQDDAITSQKRFFENHVRPIVDKKQSLFVIISDALRYECGAELSRLLQQENRFEASISYMTGSLPSYTQLGMASLLPHKVLSFQGESDNILVDGMSSVGIQGRNKILEVNSGVRATAIKAEDFMKMNTAKDGREFVKQYDLVYIYHNRVDKTGDDKTTEEKVFEAVEEELPFLMELMKKIANMNRTNIYVTSDHGFIYQNNEIEESDFTVSNHEGNPWKENRRFIIGNNLKNDVATKSFRGVDVGIQSEVDILIPKSINRLRVKGAGSRFIHGGASLQEIIIPLVKIRKKKEDTTSYVEIDIIQSTDRITTNLLAVSFIQSEVISEQVLPRKIRAGIYGKDEVLLSDLFTYTFDIEAGSERQREVKHRFQLGQKASENYKNQTVKLILEEEIKGSENKWKHYKDFSYNLNISFTNDFDGF